MQPEKANNNTLKLLLLLFCAVLIISLGYFVRAQYTGTDKDFEDSSSSATRTNYTIADTGLGLDFPEEWGNEEVVYYIGDPESDPYVTHNRFDISFEKDDGVFVFVSRIEDILNYRVVNDSTISFANELELLVKVFESRSVDKITEPVSIPSSCCVAVISTGKLKYFESAGSTWRGATWVQNISHDACGVSLQSHLIVTDNKEFVVTFVAYSRSENGEETLRLTESGGAECYDEKNDPYWDDFKTLVSNMDFQNPTSEPKLTEYFEQFKAISNSIQYVSSS